MPRYGYNTRYDPPAPALPLQIRRPGGLDAIALAALLDTGADLSVVPADLPEHLALPRVGDAIVTGYDGLHRTLTVYAVEIRIAGHQAVVEAAGFGTNALLGRDLLNALVIHLYGPEAIFDVEFPMPAPPGRG